MNFSVIAELLRDIPYTRPRHGKILFDFVVDSKSKDILELGFAHGVSSCYLAAALDEMGRGSIITIDFESSRDNDPNIFTLLERTGLISYVTPVLSESSYNWELMKLIEAQTHQGVCEPRFDFCFIDGGHLWEVDGLAFFLVDKLLKPGGWILFDDVYWTYQDDIGHTELAKTIPEEQRGVAQVERVFSLLVCQHPGFENVMIREKWGWAQKCADRGPENYGNVVQDVYAKQGVLFDLMAIFNKMRSWRVIKRAKGCNRSSLK
jgi:predicted O-methyltransferase YrrM